MFIKDQVFRAENFKALKEMHEAGIDHRVIAMFFTSEGIALKAQDISSMVHSYEAMALVKLPSKKVQALIHAKQMSVEDESLPCPV